jgi:hypothetical protein
MKNIKLKLYNKIIKSALEHGQDSEPDHEVGDLQDALSECIFRIMTVKQVKKLHDKLVKYEIIRGLRWIK